MHLNLTGFISKITIFCNQFVITMYAIQRQTQDEL